MKRFLMIMLLAVVTFPAWAVDDDNYELYLVDSVGKYTAVGYADIRCLSFRQAREDLDGDGSSSYENYMCVHYVDGTTADFNLNGMKIILFDKQTCLSGDVNSDGSVDISDVVAIINSMAGNSSYQKRLCDVNADYNVDISDVVNIINIMAGTPVYLAGAALPENIYVDVAAEYNVVVYKYDYVKDILIAKYQTSLQSLAGRNDSLKIVRNDGLNDSYLIRQLDSIY